MVLKNAKGDKTLNMIFGLVILLIISLVVLNLFFKFTDKSSKSLESASNEYQASASIDSAKQDCEQLCNAIVDTDTMIEFCGKTYQLDWNGDKITKNKSALFGKWQFCEEKIPCFVLKNDCPNANGATCRALVTDVTNNRYDIYTALSNGGYKDICNLNLSLVPAPTGCTSPGFTEAACWNADGTYKGVTANWKLKFNYT